MIHSGLIVSHTMLTKLPFVETLEHLVLGIFRVEDVLDANKIHQMSRCDTWGWSRGDIPEKVTRCDIRVM